MHAVLSCPGVRVRFDIVDRRVCAIRLKALDRAAASTGSGELGNDVDLDGNPRAVDLPGVNDSLGKPRDLGAYELQSLPPGCRRADTIFCSGFELQ